MLLTEYVEMSWNVSNREWYENLKYKFTKIRDKFLVSVNDLPPKSRRFVRLKCDFCGKEFDRRYSEYFRGRKILCMTLVQIVDKRNIKIPV